MVTRFILNNIVVSNKIWSTFASQPNIHFLEVLAKSCSNIQNLEDKILGILKQQEEEIQKAPKTKTRMKRNKKRKLRGFVVVVRVKKRRSFKKKN